MRRPARPASLAASLLVAAIAFPAGASADDAATPHALSCEFTGGASGGYEDGKFWSKPPSPIGFLIVDVDLEGQSARIVTGPSGVTGRLRIVRAINANHYLEVANEGFLNLTTVYDRDPATGAYPAIHSRHLGVLGQPVFAQYTGTCRSQ